jgi:hypothetical protein
MEFKEWLASTDYTVWDNAEVTADISARVRSPFIARAKAAWDYQQASIDGLLEDRKMDRSRINYLEQRIIDLQGHDDLSYIDKKLNEQEGE